MGCGVSSNNSHSSASASSPAQKIVYNSKKDVYFYQVKPVDPCQEHLRHKRPANFDFLAFRPSFINPFPFTNGILLEAINSIGLPLWAVKKMWKLFCSLDSGRKGCIVLDQLFVLIKESYTSTIAPFLERLYEVMVKEQDLYIYFDEFVSVCAAYCLMSHEELVSCIKLTFHMLDQDRDGTITKEEVLKFLEVERGNIRLFPSNVIRAVELYREPDAGQIHIDEFYRLAREVKYLVYPAHRLQDRLRDEVLGNGFWEEITMKLEEKMLIERINKKKQTLKKKYERRNPSAASKMNSIIPDRFTNEDNHAADDVNQKLMRTFTIHKRRISSSAGANKEAV